MKKKLGKMLATREVEILCNGESYKLTARGLSTVDLIAVAEKAFPAVKKELNMTDLTALSDTDIVGALMKATAFVDEVIARSYAGELDSGFVATRDLPLEGLIALFEGAISATFGDDLGGLKKSQGLVGKLLALAKA